MTDKQYFSADGLNCTSIKAFILNGIKGYVKANQESNEYELEHESLKIGSAVDCVLTQPDKFKIRYFVGEIQKLSDKPYLIMQETFDRISHMDISKVEFKGILDSIIVPIAREVGYWGRIKDEQKYKERLTSECLDYYNAKVEAGNREIITKEEGLQVQVTANKFITCVPGIFDNKNPNIIIYFQKAIFAEFQKTACKILLDVLVVNEQMKTIKPYDIKTMKNNVTTFRFNFKRFLYNVQAVFYTEVLKIAFPDYTILPFTFLVGSIEDNLPIQAFTLSDELYNYTLNGHADRNTYYYKGIKQAIEEINKHKELDEYELDLEFLSFRKSQRTVIDFEFKYVV